MSGSEQEKLAPPADASKWLVDQMRADAAPNGKPPRIAPVEPGKEDRIIPIGERHAFLVRLTGLLRSWGVARKAAHAAALADYEERYEKDESKREQEVANITTTVDDIYNRYPGETPAETDRPQIVVNVGQLRDKVTQALHALEAANDPPTLFTRGGLLTRLGRGGDAALDLLDADGLLAELAEAADWRKWTDAKLRDAEPSSNIVRAIRGRRALPFPPIEGVARAPFFSADGELILHAGYDPQTQTYLALDPKLAGQLAELDFPDHPTDTEVADACALVLEPFAQFPFADSASLANTIGLMLLPFVRKAINGLVPLHGATAPPEAAGTGKSILVQTACVPGVGEVDSTPEIGDANELRKKLLPVIINDLPVFMFDNLTEELSGGVLASILTTRNLAERILGHSKLFRGQVHTAFVFTANGARVSTEIRRRTSWVRLDARMAEPWKRTGFKRELPAWAFEHRAELIRACVILVQHWIDVGRPAGTATLGGFEPWSRVIGGILQCAGIEGFLTNLDDARAYDADVGAAHWHNFIQAWHTDHRENPVVAGALIESAIASSIVKEVFDFDAARRERSIATKLGVAITYHLGQTFAININDRESAEFTIVRASVPRLKGRTDPGYALARSKPAEKVREVRESPKKPLKTKGKSRPEPLKKVSGKQARRGEGSGNVSA